MGKNWLFVARRGKVHIFLRLDSLSQKSSGSQQSSDAENQLKSSGQAELRVFIENLSSVNGFQAGKAEAVAALCK